MVSGCAISPSSLSGIPAFRTAPICFAEIGAERPYHVLLGCEGRGLLQSVGWHSMRPSPTGEDIRQMYAEALGRWLACEAGIASAT